MDTEPYALKKNGNAEGTHSNSSSSRKRILEGLKIGKGADSVASSPFAPYVSHHPIDPNTLSELSKPDERIL